MLNSKRFSVFYKTLKCCSLSETDGRRSAALSRAPAPLRIWLLLTWKRSRRRIDAQHLYEFRDLFQVMQGVAGSFVVAAEQVHEEYVLPGPSAHGTRFDFAQADVAKRKHAQGLEERARQVAHAESEGSLVGFARRARLAATDQKEAREILLVVFDAGFQNLPAINPRGVAAARRMSPGLSP